jgi:hypothetical protein
VAVHPGGRDRTGHGEGIDDLRRCGGVFGIDLIKDAQPILKEGVGRVGAQVGVKRRQGAVIGARLGQG